MASESQINRIQQWLLDPAWQNTSTEKALELIQRLFRVTDDQAKTLIQSWRDFRDGRSTQDGMYWKIEDVLEGRGELRNFRMASRVAARYLGGSVL